MSRRPPADMQFGSDSFLDVVANIVGILIILIVIAGLRVSQMPVALPVEETITETAPPPPQELPPVVPDDPPLEALIAEESGPPNPAPLAPVAEPEPPRELPTWEPPDEWTAAAQDLKAEILRLEQGYRITTDQTAAVRQLEAELKSRLAKTEHQLAAKARTVDKRTQEAAARRTSRDQLSATLEELRRQIAAEEKQRGPVVEKWEHHITPISKVVEGHEQHYRLIGNRVSEVPIAALSFRLKEQIERRKDWLIKQRSHQGVVGPIGGYTMHYLVQRDNLGVLDEVRYGQGMIRISVSNWRIEPVDDLDTESAAEALRQGSRFVESLVTADEGTTLTFWVYPDSYDLYRRLQQYAHQQGFLVAARPLPFGIGISGSPNGSKSAGQ